MEGAIFTGTHGRNHIQGIAVDASTKPTGTDLNATVTISIGGFQALIAKAMK